MDKILKEFELSNIQIQNLNKYYELLVEKNKVMNLTGITEYKSVVVKHFYDSLLLYKLGIQLDNLIDVGSGAGFPGLVLSIKDPSLNITLLEPTKKRANFLSLVKESLNLYNTKVISDRAESHKAKYQVATARAVASLNILLELIIPLLNVNGYFLCMKGSSYQNEIDEASNAFKKLNCHIEKIEHFDLPFDMGKRNILIIKKDKETNKIYPRNYASIIKQPL